MSGKSPTPVPWPRVQDALRPLNDGELVLLRESIQRDGVVEAVKLLPDGRIVDGHHRWTLSRQLRRRAPLRVLTVDDDDGFRIAMNLNAARRQLTPGETRDAIERTLKTDPERSDNSIAREHSVDHKTVGAARERLAMDGEIPRPLPSKTQRRSTADERARARAMAEEGHTHHHIADTLGFNQSTVSGWLAAITPDDELAKQREHRRLRNDAAWRRLVDLNDRARRVWNEDRGAILRAIDEHPEHNLVVALAHATRRTRDVAQAVLDAIDPQLSDAERERMDAFARDSGFGT